ncbi:MAG: insulinase family protein [Treponemataceae bacterium]|nr:insulinase family protein [Treponemataceae bacterium]
MKLNDEYKGWKVLAVTELPQYKSNAIHLKHMESGMEILHLLNDDPENFFSFGFKTVPVDSTGVTHIIEHSVLCGSKNFPVKDPFVILLQQSIKTFLNAMTYPDKTVYPASSVVREDYFNLMNVYGDAVFFPRLTYNTFLQEAHRFEIDDKGELSIQGVVYNEMKGNYSSFDSCAQDRVTEALFPNSCYAEDSGGNPDVIPSLTYEQFKNYHRTHYSPANCRLFLMGDIPTETQIDFINEKFLDQFESFEPPVADQAFVLPETDGFAEIHTVGPKGNEEDEESEDGSLVQIGWITGKSSDTKAMMQMWILEELLLGHDGAPLARALMESDLGEDLSPLCGCDGTFPYITFGAGLRGVAPGDEQKVYQCIMDTLKEIAANGIPAKDIESAVMAGDFHHREIKRAHGPYALVLMENAYRGWMNGCDPVESLKGREYFDIVKKELAEDSQYIQKLVQKNFIDNPQTKLVIVTPDESFSAKMEETYRNLLSTVTEEQKVQIKKEQEALYAWQKTEDDPEAVAKIPYIKPSTLTSRLEYIKTEKTELAGNTVPCFVTNLATNGITYIDLAIPVDGVTTDQFMLLSFFARIFTSVGFNGMDWATASSYAASCAGGYGSTLFVSSGTDTADPLFNREWMLISVKMLEERTKDGVDLIFDNLETADFTDEKRLQDLINECKNEMSSSILPGGHQYINLWANSDRNRQKAIDELWNGLSQFYYIQKLAERPLSEVAAELTALKNLVQKNGIVVNVTGGSEGIVIAKAALETRLAAYTGPATCNRLSWDALKPLIIGAEETSVLFDAKCQVGYAGTGCNGSPRFSRQAAAEAVLCHWLSNGLLWEKIRTKGGAYGAFAMFDNLEESVGFATYRDPNPVHSLDVILECLEIAATHEFSQMELEKAITGCYSKEIQPQTPKGKGFSGFMRALYGIEQEMRERKVASMLDLNGKDLQQAAKDMLTRIKDSKKGVIYAKNSNYDGKTIGLNL